jgi:hypothetical protein
VSSVGRDSSAANAAAATQSNPTGATTGMPGAATIGGNHHTIGSEADERRRAKRLALVLMTASGVAALAILGLAWWLIRTLT